MENCLFCKIINGEIPSLKICENDRAVAFMDISYVNKGHSLVIPKKHSENIFDIEQEDLNTTMEIVRKISKIVKKATKADGVNIHINNGAAAGQVIHHTHIHIIPRFKEDGLKMWKSNEYKEGEREKIFKKIREQI
ncbi:MAG: Diadenosine tetraphosphate (Ap4A) hydrolase related HIT family hydrolase, Hit-like protein involved in cell-cycle regulation [Candidatus Campbellbacteria bacterium GW2011_OD1_34_28]|nr:MAG: Diadenosine tetraphosphate (Ap4A) hydrolase related HIT family hydrolase, Hit-like protein involved in cell-cycle regulation [Candidatus Campbellbacteria bacterium GW2011_OD1_34_28]